MIYEGLLLEGNQILHSVRVWSVATETALATSYQHHWELSGADFPTRPLTNFIILLILFWLLGLVGSGALPAAQHQLTLASLGT